MDIDLEKQKKTKKQKNKTVKLSREGMHSIIIPSSFLLI
jgi:hypothetical protein